MKKKHKTASCFILLLTICMAYYLDAKISDTTARNLVTFFSITFGFNITSIAILYNASYTKYLYKMIDKREQKRGIQILQSYLLTSGYLSIFSIISILLYTILFTTNDTDNNLTTNITPLTLPIIDKVLDPHLFLSSCLFGLAGLSIFLILLLMNTIIGGLVVVANE